MFGGRAPGDLCLDVVYLQHGELEKGLRQGGAPAPYSPCGQVNARGCRPEGVLGFGLVTFVSLSLQWEQPWAILWGSSLFPHNTAQGANRLRNPENDEVLAIPPSLQCRQQCNSQQWLELPLSISLPGPLPAGSSPGSPDSSRSLFHPVCKMGGQIQLFVGLPSSWML